MKTIHAAALAAATLLSTAAFASEATQNGLPVGQATVERSVTGGFQALAQSNAGHAAVIVRNAADPAHGAAAGN